MLFFSWNPKKNNTCCAFARSHEPRNDKGSQLWRQFITILTRNVAYYETIRKHHISIMYVLLLPLFFFLLVLVSVWFLAVVLLALINYNSIWCGRCETIIHVSVHVFIITLLPFFPILLGTTDVRRVKIIFMRFFRRISIICCGL